MNFFNLTDMPPLSTFRKGHLLFQEDNPCEGFFYITQGVVKIFTTDPEGKEVIHFLATTEDFIGLGCFFGQGTHMYNAHVMEDVQCCYFSRQTLKESFLKDPQLLDVILQKIGKVLDHAYNRNAHLVRFGVRQRMAICLCELANSFGRNEADGIKINLKLNREELASFLGVANETAIRFLSDFKKQGLITEKDHCLIIKDRDRLEEICQGQ